MVIPRVITSVKKMGSCRFCQVQTNHNLKFTLITCITTVDENLMCKDFEEF